MLQVEVACGVRERRCCCGGGGGGGWVGVTIPFARRVHDGEGVYARGEGECARVGARGDGDNARGVTGAL